MEQVAAILLGHTRYICNMCMVSSSKHKKHRFMCCENPFLCVSDLKSRGKDLDVVIIIMALKRVKTMEL